MRLSEAACYHEPMELSFGVIATALGIIGAIPYIRDTYRKKTKPHRIAWFLFLVLSIIALTSQFALGARESLIFYTWFVVNNSIIFGLSLRKKNGYGDISKLNVFYLLLAILAIIVWKTTDSPLLALICVLIADGIGALLILIKSYKHPGTETMAMWLLGSIASLLNLLAVGSWNIELLAAPLQIFLFSVGIVVAILLGRRLKHI